MNNSYQNQHFVPETYLKQFINTKGYCCVYNKKTKEYFETNPKKILVRRYFYDINFKSIIDRIKSLKLVKIPDSKILEKILSLCENNYSLIQRYIQSNIGWFNVITNRFLVYQLIAIQLMRTMRGKSIIRDIYIEDSGKDIEENLENILLLNEIIRLISCESENESIILEHLLRRFGKITIGINNSDIPFITSDTPVIMIDNYKNTEKQVIYYPVTPNHSIILHEANFISHSDILNTALKNVNFQKKNIILDVLNEIKETTKELTRKSNTLEEIINSDQVKILNTLMYMTAESFIISNISIKKNTVFLLDLDKIDEVKE